MKELTERQKQILGFITESAAETGRTPTIREIAAHLGITIGPVQRHIEALRSKGFLTHKPLIARGIEVTSHKPLARVPVLGRVPAGTPVMPTEAAEGYVHLDKDILKGGSHFALRVKGDSMTGSGILENDIVVVRQQAVAENNEIVVALVDGEATVKKFRKKDKEVFLEATNPAYGPLRGNNIEIVGKVIYLVRRYDYGDNNHQ